MNCFSSIRTLTNYCYTGKSKKLTVPSMPRKRRTTEHLTQMTDPQCTQKYVHCQASLNRSTKIFHSKPHMAAKTTSRTKSLTTSRGQMVQQSSFLHDHISKTSLFLAVCTPWCLLTRGYKYVDWLGFGCS